ncbi:MAG TPA: hypothetical protein VFG03_16700 [Telluria sp.]|jgi:hypothetical protein|nr:hypothetical protein [Telluria sp.]
MSGNKKKRNKAKRPGWVQLIYRLRPNLLEVIDSEVERRRVHANPGEPMASRTSVISDCICSVLLVERGEVTPPQQLKLPRVR